MSGVVTWQVGVPPALQGLAWRVFFQSRGRGIALEHHFPWIHDTQRTVSVCARTEAGLIGGLVIRPVPMADGGLCGLIGLVCVDESARGQGWSHRLLEAAIVQTQAQGWAALLLWTQTPAVYARHGFVCQGAELLVEVVRGPGAQAMPEWSVQGWPLAVLPSGDEARGLPAFAQSARRLAAPTIRGEAHAIVLETAMGTAVAEWQGDAEDVARLLLTALPARWICNAIEGDRLLGALEQLGCTLVRRPSRNRYVRWLAPDRDRVLPEIRVLDRI